VTTDNQSSATSPAAGNYRYDFSGTSASAAQVSGVAGLVLSLYPCLTQKQVSTIIERSAQKIGSTAVPYTYAPTTGRDNGTWNHEMGYGVLDAYAALNKILDFNFLQHDVVNTTEKRYSLSYILAGSNVDPLIASGPYDIQSGANVDIKATQYIMFEPGFSVEPGAVMLAHIDNYSGDCTNWTPTIESKTNWTTEATDRMVDSIVEVESQPTLISMTPNPFKNSFTVTIQVLADNDPVSISVYDVTGRLLYQYDATEDFGAHVYTVPVQSGTSMLIVKACSGAYCKSQKMIQNEME
jgi:hypothetical protein